MTAAGALNWRKTNERSMVYGNTEIHILTSGWTPLLFFMIHVGLRQFDPIHQIVCENWRSPGSAFYDELFLESTEPTQPTSAIRRLQHAEQAAAAERALETPAVSTSSSPWKNADCVCKRANRGGFLPIFYSRTPTGDALWRYIARVWVKFKMVSEGKLSEYKRGFCGKFTKFLFS